MSVGVKEKVGFCPSDEEAVETRLIDWKKFEKQGGRVFAARQVATVYCEEGKGLEMNVSPYDMVKARGEEVIRGVWGGLEIELSPQREFGKEEIEGVKNMFELAENGFDLIFWISPSGGSYIDARLVVAQAERLDNETVLKCRGIVLRKTPEELLQVATNIFCFEGGVLKSWVSDAEDLRSQPIGVDLEGEDWIDFCKRMFTGMDDVWEAIREGRDIELRDEIESHVLAVREGLSGLGLGDWKLDRAFEIEMKTRGFVLPVIGNHGGSALGRNGNEGIFNSVFNEGRKTRVDSKGNVLTWCDPCSIWFEGKNCPYCS